MIFNQLFDEKSHTYTYIISSGKGREALIIDPVIEKTNELQKEIKNQIEQDYYPALYNAYNVRDERARNMIINN